ncbi:MAG TPA: GNAT family N-acetyltransferase [Gemmatimonadaceae bacterium]
MHPVRLRPLAATDAPAARALIAGAMGATPYIAVIADALDLALQTVHAGIGLESLGLVAEREDELVGVALYGLVAGSEGTGKLHFVAVTASARLQGVASELCDAAAAALAAHGARFVIAEVADDPRIAPGRALLAHAAFREEARVADYFADRIALVVLRRETDATRTRATGP